MSISIPTRTVVAAKSMTGPGAAAMMTQPQAPWNHNDQLGREQKFMKQCTAYWKSNPWIRAAERVISGDFASVDWHLEDENDDEIDDQSPPNMQAPWSLLERPQKNLPPDESQHLTRREMWALTCRHMGVTGNAFWYLDRLESTARTPLDILYIAPWRMWPVPDSNGNLQAWVLDYNERDKTGTRLELDEVIHFTLEPPEEGFFGLGLVESAMRTITLDQSANTHAITTLNSGGRLAGIVSPKDAASAIPDDKFAQLVRDFRTINELPDAAKRVNILQGPVDFHPTAQTLNELAVDQLMTMSRDFILGLWGVPLSQIGIGTQTGLNSGDTKKYDEAALWQHAIHPRLVAFQESVQYNLLDRYEQLGVVVELEIEEPAFDDDGPRFDLLAKSLSLPMRNIERRALINLPPFGDPALDNAVWLPSTQVDAFMPPDENGVIPFVAPKPEPITPIISMSPVPQLPANTASIGGSDIRPVAKATLSIHGAALHSSLSALRRKVEREHTPDLKRDLLLFLDKQKTDITSRLRSNSTEILRSKGRDHRAWFGHTERWDRELRSILERPLTTMAQSVQAHIDRKIAPVKAAPAAVIDRALARGAARVTNINTRTRDAVTTFIVDGLEKGLSPAELADEIEASVLLDNGSPAFDELRAETIARTELMDAYNGAALGSYSDAGLTQVQAIDGDGDIECAERDGQVFDIDEADGIEDHPNGTLDWVPVLDEPVKSMRVMEDDVRESDVRRIVEEALRGQRYEERMALTTYGDGIVAKAANSNQTLHDIIDAMPPSIIHVPAPVVNIHVPEHDHPVPIVNVAPSPLTVNVEPTPITVNVPESKSPTIDVPPAQVVVAPSPPRTKTIKQNRDGSYTMTEKE